MRFKIIFATSIDGGSLVALGDTILERAIQFARRISEGEWWQVVDTYGPDDGEVVATSDEGSEW